MKNRTEQLCGNPYEVAVRLPRFDVRPVDPPVPAETTGGSLSFEDPDVMNSGTTTNLAGGSPEVTAPVRLEGQTDSEVLFTWLLVNRNLWMLEREHDAEVERILDTEARCQRLSKNAVFWW